MTVRSCALTVVSVLFIAANAAGATATNLIPSSAPHSARAVILGTGLDAADIAVKFAASGGSATAPIISRSASQLEIVVPQTATSGNVTVSNSGGTIGTLPFTLAPDPTFTTVNTLAGSPNSGSSDINPGIGTFAWPSGVAYAPNGNVYVGDSAHHQIQVVTPAGSPSVLAGSGLQGSTDGSATVARFNAPTGVAYDASRQLVYVADTGNNKIRKIAADRTVSTFAGSGAFGHADGNGTAATFAAPSGLALDASGNLYVGDSGNAKIRMVTPAGAVTTFAGSGVPGFADGAAAQAKFNGPVGVIVDSSGALYVADTFNQAIRKIAGGNVSTIIRSSPQLPAPVGVAIGGDGNLYVTDAGVHHIVKVTLGTPATATAFAGSTKGYADGPLATAKFNDPTGIAIGDVIYIGDTRNDAIRRVVGSVKLTDVYPRKGPNGGGNSIRILGTGFVSPASVKFGTTVSPSVTVVATTELLATVPAGSGTVDITVTVGGTSATLTAKYTYFAPPVISSFSPTSGPAGTSVTISGQYFDPDSSGDAVLLGSRSVAVTSASATQLVIKVPQGAVSGKFSVTTAGGTAQSAGTFQVVTEVIPPDPATVAPPNDPTKITTIYDSTSFLYTGSNPIQTGVAPGTITRVRAAVIRGRVLDRNSQPLPGVRVTILNHPEYGKTLSRNDGMFDMAVNGGGQLTVHFDKSGFIPADRNVTPNWNDFASSETVLMIGYDPVATVVDLTAPGTKVARGSTSTDADGTRTATALFPAGTTATMMLPDGSTRPLSTLTVRATEFTVGANGPDAMPAKLPPQSNYTYCVELSADEASSAGATQLNFSQPVPFYVDNFLGFNVGTFVPTGFYDRKQGVWVGTENAIVLKIVSIVGGRAYLDITGDDVADDTDTLIGTTPAERDRLGALYSLGNTLWRASVTHFTPFDINGLISSMNNFPYPPGAGGTYIPTPPNCCPLNGSVIEAEAQTLGEEIPITGTPYHLHYRTSRVPGRRADFDFPIRLSIDTVPDKLKRIDLSVECAGTVTKLSFPPAANQSTVFAWNGKDAYDRTVQGKVPVNVTLSYVFDGVYVSNSYFGVDNSPRAPGWGQPINFRGSIFYLDLRTREMPRSSGWSGTVGNWDARAAGFGGWTLTEHHTYDHSARTIQSGDGSRSSIEAHPPVMRLVAGDGSQQFRGDNGPAKQASLVDPHSVAVGPDGAVYIGEIGRIRRVDPNTGVITTFAGNGNGAFAGDNLPAASAGFTPWGLAFDADGTLYIADQTNRRLFALSGGIVRVVGGNGGQGTAAHGGAATQNPLSPHGVAVGTDGSVFVADSDANRVYRIMRDARIYWVAGNGSYVRPFQAPASSNDATTAPLSRPAYVAVDSQARVYFTTEGNAVFVVDRDGSMSRMVSPTSVGSIYSPTPAEAGGITLNGDNLFLAQPSTNRVEEFGNVSTPQIANRDGTQGYAGDDGPALDALLNHPIDVAYGFGRLFVVDNGNSRVRVIDGLMPGTLTGDLNFPSGDGSEFYVFDSNGRHQRTVDAMTGVVTLTFQYDANGRLASLTDRDGNITRIDRDGSGNATDILGGQRTTLAIGGDGYLSSITNPAGESTSFTYSNGLMQTMTDARSGTHTFTFDSEGRLQTDRDPAGGTSTFARSGLVNDYTVTSTTGEGHSSNFHVQEREGGARTVTIVAADGTTTQTTVDLGGTSNGQLSDGTTSKQTPTGDARFGMFAPQAAGRYTTPFGHVLNTSTFHIVTLSNPADPFSSPSSETSTLTINGRTYSSTFTASSNTVQQTTPQGRQLTLTLDNKGRTSQSQVPGITPFGFTYSTSGLLTQIQQGARTTSFGYDPRRRLTSITDPLSRTVQFQYDLADRVTKQILPDSREINFAYDHSGNLTSITPPGRPQHLFTYTPVDLTQSYTPPVTVNGGATTHSYNRDRQLTLITRPDSRTVSLGYDSAGRLGTLTIARGAYSFGYDPTTGNLSSIQAPDGGQLSYNYDGSLLTQMTWSGTTQGSVAWSYDNDFAVTQENVCDALGNCQSVFYDYDTDKLLTTAGNISLTRDPGNGLVTGTAASNISDAWSYNGFGEPASYQAQFLSTPLFGQSYTRDAGGRITQKSETISGVTSVLTYGYDTAGRLTTVSKDGLPQSTYTYDTNSNRLTKNSEVGVYDAQDRLVTYNGATYSYTANGELQSKTDLSGTTTYSYDELGNLLGVTKPDGTLIEYLIDAQNRRVGKKVNGTVVRQYLYSDALGIAGELDGKGAFISTFTYATRSNVPDLMFKNGVNYRIISDHLGSPRLIVNIDDGTIAERIDYDEFGIVTNDTNPGFQPFGFAGGLYDQDTKLVRFGARDYDAGVGRWTAQDQIRFGGGELGLYTYSGNDPVNWLDPIGLREGSATNVAKRRAVDEIARGYNGSKAWAKTARKGPFGSGIWKCNLFVYDVTHQAGAEARYDDRPAPGNGPIRTRTLRTGGFWDPVKQRKQETSVRTSFRAAVQHSVVTQALSLPGPTARYQTSVHMRTQSGRRTTNLTRQPPASSLDVTQETKW